MKLHHNGNSEALTSRCPHIRGTASVGSWDSGKAPSTVTLSGGSVKKFWRREKPRAARLKEE
jgi:hypothetical protein